MFMSGNLLKFTIFPLKVATKLLFQLATKDGSIFDEGEIQLFVYGGAARDAASGDVGEISANQAVVWR